MHSKHCKTLLSGSNICWNELVKTLEGTTVLSELKWLNKVDIVQLFLLFIKSCPR